MITSPDPADTRSRLADWIEMRAVFDNNGAGSADIASLHRLASNGGRVRDRDEDGNEVVEEEILETDLEELIDRVAEEIGSRAESLGDEYAFEIERPFHIVLKGHAERDDAHWVYLFLLIMSAYGAGRLPKSALLERLVRQGRTLFHACASIGVAGLMRNAHTMWFGWPRPEKTAFARALHDLAEQMGWGRPKDPPPPGFPDQPKDDGIDVVGWRRYRDGRNGVLVVLCQAATGNNWNGKDIGNDIDVFKDWFEIVPYGKAMASIAIPFPLHHDLPEDAENGFEAARIGYANRTQTRHGVLIDRLRIVEAVHDVRTDTVGDNVVGGLEKMEDVKRWVVSAIAEIEQAGQS